MENNPFLLILSNMDKNKINILLESCALVHGRSLLDIVKQAKLRCKYLCHYEICKYLSQNHYIA